MKAQGFIDRQFSAISRSPGRCRYLPRTKPMDFGPDNKGSSPTEVSLAGEWAFCLFEGEGDLSEGLFDENFDLTGFEKTRLPRLFDSNSFLPFSFPHVPGTCKTALFLRDINLDFKGQKTYLVFEGFLGGLAVYINGQPAACADGTGHLTEFEVTRFLKPGKNRIAIVLRSLSELSFFEGKACRKFGSVAPFYLLTRSKGHISDIRICTSLSDGFSQAKLTAEAEGDFIEGGKCRLYDQNGERVATAEFDEEGRAQILLKNPRLWSDEHPDMYLLETEICGEYIYKYVGFKTVDCDLSEGLRLNGRKIRFHGGIYEPLDKTPEQIKSDILTLKQNHVNALVIKGFCDCERVLSLCDKYGILAVADISVDSSLFDMAEDGRIYRDGTVFAYIEEIIRDRTVALRSHTCLAGFGFLNFAGDGKNVHEAIALVKQLSGLPVYYNGDPADTVRTSSFEQRPDIYFTDPSLTAFDDPFAGKKPVAVVGELWEGDDIRVLGGFVERPFDCLAKIKSSRPFFKVDEIDASTGDFYITNLFSFSYLSHLECSFEVTSLGKVTKQGFVGALPLSPGKCQKVHIDFDLPDGEENYIRFEFKRLGDCKWAKDGFSEGSVQFELPKGEGSRREGATYPDLSMTRTGGKITVKGKNFSYLFSEVTGRFARLEYDRKDAVNGPVGLKFLSEDTLLPVDCSCDVSRDGQVAVICCKYVFMADKKPQKETVTAVWCVYPDGRVTVDCSSPAGDFEIDRFGLEIPLKNTDFIYFGMGESSGYNGIFRTAGSAKRRVRSCVFDKNDRSLCVFCGDRMTVETDRQTAFVSSFDGSKGELSLCLCPESGSNLIFE